VTSLVRGRVLDPAAALRSQLSLFMRQRLLMLACHKTILPSCASDHKHYINLAFRIIEAGGALSGGFAGVYTAH